jgi:hypothetical protein
LLRAARLRVAALLAIGLLAGWSPSAASGATTVGQTAPNAGSVLSCGGATLFVTPTVGAAPDYVIPSGGGVLTSWSVQGPTSVLGPTDDLKLKILESSSPNTYVIAAEDSLREISPGILNTFPVRIPVAGGELVALWVPSGSQPCTFLGGPGDVQEYRGGSFSEPAVGDTFVTDTTDPGRRTNVSARLEPDTDRDAFGDETQDKCVGSAGTANGCPSTVAIGKIKQKGDKKVKVTATVPGAGTLRVGSATDPALASAAATTSLRAVTRTLTATSKQEVVLTLKLTKSAVGRLQGSGKLKIKVKALYTPPGAAPGSAVKKKKLKS